MSNWQSLPLAAPGRSLIEASAGTGKTWTIAVLYLRLILEGPSPPRPREIVVTTFTDAAAQELRERLRSRLLQAESFALQEDAPQAAVADPALEWLRQRWLAQDGDQRARDLTRLRGALIELDQAPITTLHSLCRRVLSDYPFECASNMQFDNLVDGDSLHRQLTDDTWRWLMQDADNPLRAELGSLELSRDKLGLWLRAYLAPGVSVPEPGRDELDVEALRPLADQAQVVLGKRGWLVTRKRKLTNAIGVAIDLVEGRIGLEDKTLKAPLENLSKDGFDEDIDADAKNRPEILATLKLLHAISDARIQLQRNARLRLLHPLIAYARRRRTALLAASATQTFDELIVRVHDALHGASGSLAEHLFKTWPVALVDEFQDTDSLQYRILDRIYRDIHGQPRGRLVMIGDPKQAIYRFRGGDVEAYMRAAATAGDQLRLDVNYRSSQALVEASNQFFELAGDCLSSDPDHAIRYQPVRADASEATALLRDGEPCQRPLTIHLLRAEDDEDPSAAVRRNKALRGCANQIAETLQSGRLQLRRDGQTRHVGPGDIAVLLPGHADIAALRALLTERGVPCVTTSRESVFQSSLARDLQVLLHAIWHDDQPQLLRAAYLTPLWGGTPERLRQFDQDAAASSQLALRFRHWRQLWLQTGVLDVVNAVAVHCVASIQTSAQPDRSLTDLRHLGELLQQQTQRCAGVEELLSWYAQQRTGRGDEEDSEGEGDSQMRIESDGQRVRLMTLHVSKGLEFPLVWLPLMFKSGGRFRDGYVISAPDPDDPEATTRVPGFGDKDKHNYLQQGQDERFRLFYVALTRAVFACQVYAMQPDREASAASKSPAKDPDRAPLDALLERIAQRQGIEKLEGPALQTLRQRTPNIDWRDEPWPQQRCDYRSESAAQGSHSPPRPLPRLRPPQSLHSFTRVVDARGQGWQYAESPADDEPAADEAQMRLSEDPVERAAKPEHPALLALAEVKGPAFGVAVHTLFEQREIGVPLTEQQALLRRCLLREGVIKDTDKDAERWNATLSQRLQGALTAPLGLAGAEQMSLADLRAADLLVEMEFNFQVDAVSLSALRSACARHGEPRLVPARVMQLNGLFTGKIDLLFQHRDRFHVLDYKGNFLGTRLDDYRGTALAETMGASSYRFQALLYSLASRRYLRQRLGERWSPTMLGEYVYLFVRAAGLDGDAGIWREEFDAELLDAADAVLAGQTSHQERQ